MTEYQLRAKAFQWGTLDHAIALAAKYHQHQIDKAGVPYIVHVMQVMCNMKFYDERTVAALHDIVEDTRMTLDRLTLYKFPPSTIASVNAITRRRHENYLKEYIPRVADNKSARLVKIQDLLHNMDMGRFQHKELTEQDRLRNSKYRQALEFFDDCDFE